MKKAVALLLVAVACVALAAGGFGPSARDAAFRDLELSASSGQLISHVSTYSGGEGASCTAVALEDESVLRAIQDSAAWSPLPVDETVRILMYGEDVEDGRIGPYATDGVGHALAPEIQNGYYRLIDRHEDAGAGILERNSFNFTVGLYDADSDTLYCCKLDT